MNEEKQIEEMTLIIDKAEEEYSEIWNEWFYDHKEGTKIDNEFLFFAKMLYAAGYRKQSEGEWVVSDIPEEKYVCSVCGGACWYYDWHGDVAKSRYCPNCGARMKGENK